MRLKTERLLLREFVAGDWSAVLAYHTDPRYLRFYAWAGRTAAETRDFIQMFLDQQVAQPRDKFQLAVTTKADGRLIGNCGLRLDAPTARTANIGYELAPEHWGQGYATEATRAILAYGFTAFGLHRVWATCVADNIASAHVLVKLGLRREAHLREVAYHKGRWWDEQIYAILEDEWRALSTSR